MSEGKIPLTAAQHYVVANEWLAGMPTAVEHFVRLRGPLDAERFERALVAVMRGNPQLRVTVDLARGLHDTQRFDPDFPSRVRTRMVEVAHLPPAKRREAELQALLDAHEELTSARPFEGRLIQVDTGTALFVWRGEMAHTDGLSNDQLVAAVLTAYDAIQGNTTDADATGADAVVEQVDELLAAERSGYEVNHAYWSEKLAATPLCTQIADPDPRWSVGCYAGWDEINGTLTRETTAAVSTMVDAGTTLHGVLLASLFSTLHLASGVSRLAVCVNMPSRTPGEMWKIGRFAQLFPVTVAIEPETTFRSVLAQVRQELRDTLAHRKYPNSAITSELARQGRLVGAVPMLGIVYDGWPDRRHARQSPPGSELVAEQDDDLATQFELALRQLGPQAKLPGLVDNEEWSRPFMPLTTYGRDLYYLNGLRLLTVPSNGRVDFFLKGGMVPDSLAVLAAAWSDFVRDACMHPDEPITSLWGRRAQREMTACHRAAVGDGPTVEFRGFLLRPEVIEEAVSAELGSDGWTVSVDSPGPNEIAITAPAGAAPPDLATIRAAVEKRVPGYLLPTVLLSSAGDVVERFQLPAVLDYVLSSDPTVRAIQTAFHDRVGWIVGEDENLMPVCGIEPWTIASLSDAIADVLGRRVGLFDVFFAGTIKGLVAAVGS